MKKVGEWKTIIIYSHYILPIISMSLVIIMAYLTIQFIRDYILKRFKIIKLLFIATVSFFCITITFNIVWILISSLTCHDTSINGTLYSLAWASYGCHIYLIIGILYYRLYYITKGTFVKISLYQCATFYTFYILNIILYIIGTILYLHDHDEVADILISIIMIISIILTLWLMIMTVAKLVLVYRVSKDEELMRTISKASLLSIITLVATILVNLFFLTTFRFKSVHVQVIGVLLHLLNSCSNYFMIWLSFKHYKQYYSKICGICDSCCYGICKRCFPKDSNKSDLESVVTESVSTGQI